MIDGTGMPQTAVLVGGTSDIGTAVVRALAGRHLQKVLLTGRHDAGLQRAARGLGDGVGGGLQVHTVVHDVTDVAAHRRLVAECAERLGQVDLVVMAAGVLGDAAAAASDPLETARVLDTNCTGPAALLVAFAGLLESQGQGRIVVFSSVAGVRVRRANFVYGASKAGLDAFAQGLQAELAGTGVSVTIVRPGWVATRMTEGMAPAPFATTAEKVAGDVVAGLTRGSDVVWSPPVLRGVFGGLRLLPKALWRRLPG